MRPARPPSYVAGGLALILGAVCACVAAVDGAALGAAVLVALLTERTLHGRSASRAWSTVLSVAAVAGLVGFVLAGDPTGTAEILTAISVVSTTVGIALLWSPASRRFAAATEARRNPVQP